MISPQIIWDGLLRRLCAELSPSVVDAWLRPLIPATSEGPIPAASEPVPLRLLCPTPFHRDRVRERFLRQLDACAAQEGERGVRIELDVADAGDAPAPAARPRGAATAQSKPSAPSRRTRTAAVRPRRTSARVQQQSFDNFVVGDCNALAREACMALLRDDSPAINPLYLAGGTGLGKTHLSRAVVRDAVRQGVGRVVYTSAEGFTNEFMTAIRARDTRAFKRRFRNGCDLLVLEDVCFLEGKKQTQLELFHSVQHVLDAGGRVIATGNRLPRFMTELDERVRSQLASGLVAEVHTPDAAVRRSILRAKAASGGVRLPAECLDLMVQEIRGSVRELEGVLIQLVTTASLLKRPIDLDFTRKAISQKCAGASIALRKPEPEVVISVVSGFFKTSPEALASRSRRRNVLVPRQLAMYLCRRYTDASLAEIGRALGRDHPAVKNAVKRVERDILERAPLRYQVEALCGRLDELTGVAASRPAN